MSDGERPGGDHPVLLFDGVCNLCNGVVQFIIPRDPAGRIRFAPLQSETGKALLSGHGLPPGQLDSVVLVEERPFEERNYVGSEATRVYEEIRARGRVVDPSGVPTAVAESVEASTTTDSAAPESTVSSTDDD